MSTNDTGPAHPPGRAAGPTAKAEPPPIPDVDAAALPPTLRACLDATRLKQLYRRGWLRAGVPPGRCESVADHTFGVALLALFLAPAVPGLDPLKALRMALLHDLGEVDAGDVTPDDGVDPTAKHAAERRSVARLVAEIDVDGGPDWLALWDDYERGASPEARFVRQLDRLEMALQAAAYALQGEGGPGRPLAPFFESARRVVTDPDLARALKALESLAHGPSDCDPD